MKHFLSVIYVLLSAVLISSCQKADVFGFETVVFPQEGGTKTLKINECHGISICDLDSHRWVMGGEIEHDPETGDIHAHARWLTVDYNMRNQELTLTVDTNNTGTGRSLRLHGVVYNTGSFCTVYQDM